MRFPKGFPTRSFPPGVKLTEAFKTGQILNQQRKGGMWDVKSLRRDADLDGTCWFAGKGWWLSTAAAGNSNAQVV